MNLEEEFNNEIKNKLDSREFGYSEASWEKANAMIQEAQKKKKRRIFFYFFTLGIVLIGTIIVLQFPFDDSNKIVTENTTTNSNNSTEVSDVQELKTNPSTADTGEKEPNNKPNTSVNSSNKEVKTETVKNEIEDQISSNGKIVTTLKQRKTTNKGSQSNTIKDSETVEKIKGDVEIKISAQEKIKGQETKPETHPGLSIGQDKTVNHESPVTTTSTTKADSVNGEKSFETPNTLALSNDSIKKNETVQLLIEEKKDTTKSKTDNLQVLGFAGVAFTPGFIKNISITESINPSAGIYIRKSIKSNLGIGAGLYYTLYGNISETPKVFNNTTQDFGYKNETTEIKQSRLHYLKLPIMIDFKIGKNNFSAGPQFMYLLTSSSKVSTYKESYGIKTDNSSQKIYGYTSGFASYDISLILGYRREITNKVSLQFLLDVGYMDIKSNLYFNSTTFDRNKSFQINFGYKLFSK